MYTELAKRYQAYLNQSGAENTEGNAMTFLMFSDEWAEITMEQAYGITDNLLTL